MLIRCLFFFLKKKKLDGRLFFEELIIIFDSLSLSFLF